MNFFKKSKTIKKLTCLLDKERMLAKKAGTKNSEYYYSLMKCTKRAIDRINKL